MKDRFFYITLIVFVLTLGITGFLYYRLSLTTVVEYDNAFVDQRNEVITQVDTLSNTLNTAENKETVEQEIQTLTEKRANLEKVFNEAKQPSRNSESIVNANRAFLDKTQEIIETAEEYEASFTDDNLDPVEKMNQYNTKVSELNEIIEEIKDILEENKGNLF